ALGGEVVVKGLVEVDMIARQIGENSGGEMAAPQAVQRQGVGTRFHHGVSALRAANLRKETLQVLGFRRGIRRGEFAARRAISDGAKQSGLRSRSAHDRINQRSRG